ncbi:MAG: AAA family ATPase [Lachnospiraceae bacterium]|nr:AAA family ATPase [Lachnospiraceae bacterium]
MKISRLMIKNYRNLRDIDIHLNGTVALIGENNSGKSDLLRAVTLPFLTDETGYSGKNLSWIDINDSAKDLYNQYIIENQNKIKEGEITSKEFAENLPIVTVEVHLTPEKEEKQIRAD